MTGFPFLLFLAIIIVPPFPIRQKDSKSLSSYILPSHTLLTCNMNIHALPVGFKAGDHVLLRVLQTIHAHIFDDAGRIHTAVAGDGNHIVDSIPLRVCADNGMFDIAESGNGLDAQIGIRFAVCRHIPAEQIVQRTVEKTQNSIAYQSIPLFFFLRSAA